MAWRLTNKHSPVLYRFFYMLTPKSELPSLPTTIRSYWSVHIYTLTQIILTVGIFVTTLTKAAPAFPIIIIALVPVRLLLMNKVWNRETLRYVDAWACRDGTPEDEEDRLAKATLAAEDVKLNAMQPRVAPRPLPV